MLSTKKLPGLLLCLVLAILSISLTRLPLFQAYGISMLIVAIVLGIILGNTIYTQVEKACGAGVNFSKQYLLRLAIILFGLKLSFQDIQAVGASAILIDTCVIVSTFFFTFAIGTRLLKLDRESVALIGCGSSICGAAAVMAAQPVLKADSEKVAVAVSTVVVFGTLAMLLYPVAYWSFLHQYISAPVFGIYTGATVHEVAQVAAVGHSLADPVALNNAVTTKMIRVLILAPFLFALSVYEARRHSTNAGSQHKIVIPWFAVGFIAMACVNSLNVIPPQLAKVLIYADDVLLTMAMGALGLTTHASAIRRAGFKPLLLALIVFIWLILAGGMIQFCVASII